MRARRILELTREIHALYQRNCALAEQYNTLVNAEGQSLVRACRGRHSPISELNYFTDVFDRQQAIQRALAERDIRWRTSLFAGVSWFALFLVNWNWLTFGGGLNLALIVTILLGGGVIWLHQYWTMNSEVFRRALRKQLRQRGVPICMSCGYDLRETGSRCPECAWEPGAPNGGIARGV